MLAPIFYVQRRKKNKQPRWLLYSVLLMQTKENTIRSLMAKSRPSEPIRVAIAEDHLVLRQGLTTMLSEIEDLKLVLEASDGQQLLEKLRNIHADILLLDIEMPRMNGFKVLEAMQRQNSKTRVIVLSAYSDKLTASEVREKGACGLLTKSSSFETILTAIREVHTFGSFYQEPKVNQGFDKDKYRSLQHIEIISRREREVLELVCLGMSNEEISKKLFISVRTIENHRSSLLAKTASRNVVELVTFAIVNGLIEMSPKYRPGYWE